MFRTLIAFVAGALLLAGCAAPVVDPNAPGFRYGVVVDGKIARTVDSPAGRNRMSVVVQPRSGESPIWQNYRAAYAHIDLRLTEGEMTPTGGRKVTVSGEVEYYRDLKMTRANGDDVVVAGKPVESVDVETQKVTVEPGKPQTVKLAEGLYVDISLVPRTAPAAAQ
jgi:hypothetical protein